MGIVIALGLILLVTSYPIAVFIVMLYARGGRADKGSTLMSDDERGDVEGTLSLTDQTIAGWSSYLTNVPFGKRYFAESATWFLLIGIVIGVVSCLLKHDTVNEFMRGCADMMGVVMIVGLSRGFSILMSVTGLSNYVLNRISTV